MSSGVEAAIAMDAAVIVSLGTSRILGGAGRLTAAGAQALAALAEGRADAHAAALAEAERHERAVRAVLEHNARIAVLTESADRHRAHVAIAMPLEAAGLSVEELVTWSQATGPLLDQAEDQITRHIAASAVGSIFGLPTAALTVETGTAQARTAVAPGTPGMAAARRPGRQEAGAGEGEGAEVPGRPVVSPRAATLVRVMSRLAPDTTEADRRYVGEAAERVGDAATEAEAEGLLTEVRLRVRAANVHTAERHAEAAADAARREAAEQAAAERDYLLNAVTSAFEELGYQVDEGFETLTAHEGAIVLSKDGWPDHAIKMRVDDDTTEGLDEGPGEASPKVNIVRAALVRTVEPAGEEERRLDVEREQQWCAAFEAARVRLTDAGISSDVRWRIDPGEHRLPVAPEARQTRTRTRQRERSRERNARQEGGR